MKKTHLFLGMTALLSLPMQQASGQNHSAPSSATTPPVGTVWQLKSLTVGGKTQTPPTALARPTLSFDGRTATGSTFCNSYRSSYASRADILRFGPAVTTRRACRSTLNTLEQQYLSQLAKTSRYIVSGPNLTLYSGSQGRMLFVAQARATVGGPAVATAAPAPATPAPVTPAPVTPVPVTTVQPMMVNPAPAISQKGLPPARTIFDRSTASLGPDEQLMVVGPQLADCTAGVVSQRCLLVKRPAEMAWNLFYGQIEGFSFRPGTTSLLRVRLERLSRPAADGSSVRYRLVRVLGTQMVKS